MTQQAPSLRRRAAERDFSIALSALAVLLDAAPRGTIDGPADASELPAMAAFWESSSVADWRELYARAVDNGWTGFASATRWVLHELQRTQPGLSLERVPLLTLMVFHSLAVPCSKDDDGQRRQGRPQAEHGSELR